MVKVFSVVVAVVILLMASVVMAEGLTDMLDNLAIREGVGVDLSDGEEIVNLATADLVLWEWEKDKPIAALGAGIATDFDDVAYPVVTASYLPGSLGKYGFSYPYDKYIVEPQIGVFLGRDIDTIGIWHYGIQASIKIKL